MPQLFLAEFEMYVLLAVAQLGHEAYGLAIRKCIEARTGRPVAVGALYTTMARLESKGLLEMREPEQATGKRGRPRRYCSITQTGREAVSHSVEMLNRMADGARLAPSLEGAE